MNGAINIPYNRAADPWAYAAGGLTNLLGGVQQGQQRQRLSQWGQGLDPKATALQILMSGLQQGIDPSLALTLGTAVQRSAIGQAQLQSEKARTAHWKRPATRTVSPLMKMVGEGLLSLKEAKKLARKEADDDLNEKDIISIMHTIERALASTYTPLNEPLPGEKYAKRRQYYAQQLEVYRNRLDQIRGEKGLTGRATGQTLPRAGQVSETPPLPTTGRIPEVPGEEMPPQTPTGKRWIPDDTRYYIEPPTMRGKVTNWMALPKEVRKQIWQAYEKGWRPDEILKALEASRAK